MTFRTLTIASLILCSLLSLTAQNDSIFLPRKNTVQLSLISLPPLFNGLNQNWLGLEYQRNLNEKYSISILVDFGLFENYTFTKYYNFFDEDEGYYHVRNDVKISGYHIIPSLRYNVVNNISKANISVYISPKVDFYQYFLKKETYNSLTDKTSFTNNSTYRFNAGFGLGAQYIAFSRLTMDLNLAIFTKLFSHSSNPYLDELYPENSFWRSDNNNTWTTINFMIGYSFGGNVKKSNK